MKNFFYLILLSAFCSFHLSEDTKEYNINDFQRTYFKIINKESNFYRVKTQLPNNSSKDILATGYLSKDLNVDILMIDRDSQELDFRVYNDEKNGVFESGGTFSIDKKVEGETILNAHFIELPKSGSNGLAIITKYNEKESDATHFRLIGYILKEKKNKDDIQIEMTKIENFDYDYEPQVDRPSEPLNFQLFDRSKDDDSLEVKNYWLITLKSQRKIITYNEDSKNMELKDFSEYFNTTPQDKSDSKDNSTDPDWLKDNYFLGGGSFHFVDLNLDCRADIILETLDKSTTTRYLEFYFFQDSKQPFQFIKRVSIDPQYTSPRLFDLRQANTLDLVFYNRAEQSLDIFMSRGPDKTKDPQNISTYCSSGSKVDGIGFPDIDDRIALEKNTSYSYRWHLNSELYESELDNAGENFNFVDLNMNGYPDLVFVVKQIIDDETGVPTTTGKLKILKNNPCTDSEANEIYTGDNFEKRCRSFKEEEFENYNKNLQTVNTERFGLFDLGERGDIGFFLIDYTHGKVSKILF
jgi:hypothetical protein